jgi:heptosyltransferase II
MAGLGAGCRPSEQSAPGTLLSCGEGTIVNRRWLAGPKIRHVIGTCALWLRSVAFSVFGRLFRSRRYRTPIDTATLKNILVIAQPRIGDAVASLPFLAEMRRALPGAVIEVLANAYCSGLFAMAPDVNAVDVLAGRSFLAHVRTAWQLRRKRFDTVFDLNTDYTFLPALMARIACPTMQIGFDVLNRGFLFSHPVAPPTLPVHITDELLMLAGTAGCGHTAGDPHLVVSREAQASVNEALGSSGVTSEQQMIVGMHPGGHYYTQRWMPERFAETAERIRRQHGATIVLFGDRRESDIIRGICGSLTPPPLLFTDRPIDRVAGMIQRCSVFVCNNSGLLHVAAAVGTPTVSTMGPTVALRWWPRGDHHVVFRKELPCIGCGSGVCLTGTHDCMRMITVEEVMAGVADLLMRTHRGLARG